PPAERVDYERRGHVSPVGVDGEAGTAVHLRSLEPRVALRVKQRAELRVVECGEGAGQAEAACPVGRVHDEVAERLPDRVVEPQAVEGSNGLLIEVDGQIVPNDGATIVPFSEGDVVSGKVVRIDKDEVLVDIGYKSEGVIPSNELSIRKSANPHDEVELGEEV